MPEGPSILLLQRDLSYFINKTILEAEGYAELDYDKLVNRKVLDVKTWGKHFFICLSNTIIELHLQLFGSYTINERKPKINPKLSLKFAKDELNFYVVRVKLIDSMDEFDERGDVMNTAWDPELAKQKLKTIPETFICDALMDQHIFSGVGNIIKNEALWLAKIHPLTRVKDVTVAKQNILMKEIVKFAFEFLQYKEEGTVIKNCGAYQQEICRRCKAPILKAEGGKTKRKNYWCEKEQILKSTTETNGKSKKSTRKKG